MAKLTAMLLLHLLTSKLALPAAAAAVLVENKPSSVSAMSQFMEQQNTDELGWTHLLPSNYYSELNKQYYVRFRRHSMLDLKDLRRKRSYPFEYARYL